MERLTQKSIGLDSTVSEFQNFHIRNHFRNGFHEIIAVSAYLCLERATGIDFRNHKQDEILNVNLHLVALKVGKKEG